MAIPSFLKLIIGVAGVFGVFSLFALLQEDVYKKEYDGEFFTYTLFMMACERSINSIVAGLFVLIFGSSGCKVPVTEIFISGVTQMISMSSSNEALRYVSYPTQVLCKSCKMVPVFIFGILLAGKGKEYKIVDYLKVAVVTAGVLVFNFGKKAKKNGKPDSPWGLGLICLSLTLDGFTGGLQDKVKKTCKDINPEKKDAKLTPFEMMFYSNFSGAVFAIAVAAATGQLQSGLAFVTRSPALLKAIMTFACCSALGQCFIFMLLAEFGALVTTTVTTTRKIFSTVYSVFRNPDNSLNEMQWTGCIMVFVGILFDMVLKMTKKPAPKEDNKDKKKK
jgi:UDP-galactose transporter B1